MEIIYLLLACYIPSNNIFQHYIFCGIFEANINTMCLKSAKLGLSWSDQSILRTQKKPMALWYLQLFEENYLWKKD